MLDNQVSTKNKILIISTDSEEIKGGIAKSVSGFFDMLKEKGHRVERIASHKTSDSRILMILRTFMVIFQCLVRLRGQSDTILYIHAGGIISISRKLFILSAIKLFFPNVKVNLHLHSPTIKGVCASSFQTFILKSLVNKADKVITVANWWANYVGRKLTLGDKIGFIYNPVLYDGEFILDKQLSFSRYAAKNILFMSRLVPGKGAEYIIDVAKVTPEFNFLIAGDGPLLAKLQREVAEGDIANVKFLGWIDDSEKKSLFKSTTIFMLPSLRDSFGMGYIEAMSHGIPCIGFNLEAIPEVVSGEVVEFNDDSVSSLSKSIYKITKDQCTYHLYSKKAFSAVEKFSFDNVYLKATKFFV